MSKCIVLNPSARYSEENKPFLRELLSEGPDLFSVVGPYAESWEDGMDDLCVMLGVDEGIKVTCNTTAHPNEPLEEVVAFATQWCELKGWKPDVRVVNT